MAWGSGVSLKGGFGCKAWGFSCQSDGPFIRDPANTIPVKLPHVGITKSSEGVEPDTLNPKSQSFQGSSYLWASQVRVH